MQQSEAEFVETNDGSASSVGSSCQAHLAKNDPFRLARNAVWKCDIPNVAPTVDLHDKLSITRWVIDRFDEQARTGNSLFNG